MHFLFVYVKQNFRCQKLPIRSRYPLWSVLPARRTRTQWYQCVSLGWPERFNVHRFTVKCFIVIDSFISTLLCAGVWQPKISQAKIGMCCLRKSILSSFTFLIFICILFIRWLRSGLCVCACFDLHCAVIRINDFVQANKKERWIKVI